MKKWACALGAAALLWAGGAAGAENVMVEGLGTLSFPSDVQVTDGKDTAVEAMIRRNMASPKDKGNQRAALMQFLTVPDRMKLLGDAEDSPVSRARVYQLVTRELRGTYTMMVFAFSGDIETLFKGNQKDIQFWSAAFDPGQALRLAAHTNKPVITLDEFRKAAKESMRGKRGPDVDFQILDASSWKPFRNDDGTIRWQQTVQITVTNDAGLVVPMWIESVLYRNPAGRMYILIFTGSHESGRVLADDILYALHGLEREKL